MLASLDTSQLTALSVHPLAQWGLHGLNFLAHLGDQVFQVLNFALVLVQSTDTAKSLTTDTCQLLHTLQDKLLVESAFDEIWAKDASYLHD